ncbi:MAG: copper resistance protein CopC [Chloroflexota bacterium]
MKINKRTIWSIVIVVIYSAWTVTSVSAHALLLRSNPAANAVLDTPPVQVVLFFSEPLEPKLSSISVIDSNSLIVDVGDVRVDPDDSKRMTVSLRSLTDGVYTVTWKAVSSADGHQTVGTYPFAVGNANANAVKAIQQSSSAKIPFSALLAKFIMLASLALLVGQRLFIALVWEPALKSDQSEVTQPAVWKTLYRIALIGMLLSIAIGILSQAGQTTGKELSFPWDPDLGRVLIETRLGLIWLLRLALTLCAIWLLGWHESPIKNWLSFALFISLLLTIALTSHAATETKPLLPILDDWIHLIGMAFWLGGIVYLYTGIRQLQQTDERLRTHLTALLTRRFSANALVTVALIGVTGFYSAYLRVGTWSAALTTLYGHVLLIKQGFVAGLLLIAAVNLLIISPRLNRERLQGTGNANLVALFGKILIVELTLAGLLLASVSFLTYIPPAKIVSPVADFTADQKADDLTVKININPAHVGENVFMLVMVTPDGQAVKTAKTVLLRFTPSRANIPPSELQLIGDGTGMFMAKGSNLSLPDQWQVQAVVRRENKFDVFANFDVNLQKPGSANTTASTQTGGLLLTIGLFVALITFSIKAHKGIRFGLGIPLALLAVISGVMVLTRPPVVENTQANPIPANRDSISAGEVLFVTNCVPCHGVFGKGDGPVGLTMNPRPADLTLHAIPGVHTDAQLYEWVTNGFPGTRMPPFKSVLSDTDRWNLVNFIRTLAPK